jgi:hypothetical protein
MTGRSLGPTSNPLGTLNNLSKLIGKATKILFNNAKSISPQIRKTIANQRKINYPRKGQSRKLSWMNIRR